MQMIVQNSSEDLVTATLGSVAHAYPTHSAH